MADFHAALDLAIQYVEWERPIKYDEPQEIIAGFTRYAPAAKPNKEAARKANEIRELAGLPMVDYAKEYPHG